MPQLLDLRGKRFARLVVTGRAPNRGRKSRWHCDCDCGGKAVVSTGDLRAGHTESCGCIAREMGKHFTARHRRSRTIEYRVWAQMIGRCTNPKNSRYAYYGGRGIVVCSRWRKGEDGIGAFECFLADVGPKPGPGFSIDRVNNDGPYEPGNVRWATKKQQISNRRRGTDRQRAGWEKAWTTRRANRGNATPVQ
jgi:hypothetical protein